MHLMAVWSCSVRTQFWAKSRSEQCTQLACIAAPLLSYIQTPAVLPVHETWGAMGDLLRKLHTRVAVPYIQRLRTIMLGPSTPLLADSNDGFRAQLVSNVVTPAQLAQRQVAPGGWCRGDRCMPPPLHKHLKYERTGHAQVVDPDGELLQELQALRHAKQAAEQQLAQVHADLIAEREIAQAYREQQQSGGPLAAVLQAALEEALPTHLAAEYLGRTALLHGSVLPFLARDDTLDETAKALAAKGQNLAADAIACVGTTDGAQRAAARVQSVIASAVGSLAVPIGSDPAASGVTALRVRRAVASAAEGAPAAPVLAAAPVSTSKVSVQQALAVLQAADYGEKAVFAKSALDTLAACVPSPAACPAASTDTDTDTAVHTAGEAPGPSSAAAAAAAPAAVSPTLLALAKRGARGCDAQGHEICTHPRTQPAEAEAQDGEQVSIDLAERDDPLLGLLDGPRFMEDAVAAANVEEVIEGSGERPAALLARQRSDPSAADADSAGAAAAPKGEGKGSQGGKRKADHPAPPKVTRKGRSVNKPSKYSDEQ